MPRPLLPPRGVHVPAQMIYHSQLPPAVILTWIQLRGLAWDGKVTPPLRVHELIDLTGKGRTTLYNHLSQLRSKSALSWHNTEQGMMIVSFADNPSKIMDIEESSSSIPESRNPESGNLDSGFRTASLLLKILNLLAFL